MKHVYSHEEITPGIRVALGLNQALRNRLAFEKRALRKIKRNALISLDRFGRGAVIFEKGPK